MISFNDEFNDDSATASQWYHNDPVTWYSLTRATAMRLFGKFYPENNKQNTDSEIIRTPFPTFRPRHRVLLILFPTRWNQQIPRVYEIHYGVIQTTVSKDDQLPSTRHTRYSAGFTWPDSDVGLVIPGPMNLLTVSFWEKRTSLTFLAAVMSSFLEEILTYIQSDFTNGGYVYLLLWGTLLVNPDSK